MKRPEITLGPRTKAEMRKLINDFVAYTDYLEKKLARDNIVLSDADFDDMMSHEDDEPNEALVDLMKETT